MNMTSMATTPSAANEVAKTSTYHYCSPVLAQAGNLFPNTPMAVEQLFHLQFNISFSPDPTACHDCPYTTIGADINITRPPPTPKTYQPDAEDILKTINPNADNNLQHHKHGKLGRMHKPSTPTTPFIYGDEVISKLYQKTWSLSLSPLTPGYDLVQCYRHSSPPPTILTKNPGAPHTPTTNITGPMPTSCTNLLPNYHAHLGYSHLLTSDGRNLPRASPT
jgi:hypothetical protein